MFDVVEQHAAIVATSKSGGGEQRLHCHAWGRVSVANLCLAGAQATAGAARGRASRRLPFGRASRRHRGRASRRRRVAARRSAGYLTEAAPDQNAAALLRLRRCGRLWLLDPGSA